MLYPSVDLMYQAKELTDIMNNVTQNESPCSIPRLTLTVSIFYFPFFVFISIEISQVLTIFLMKSISTSRKFFLLHQQDHELAKESQ